MLNKINQNSLNKHSAAYYQCYQKWVDALDLYEPLPGGLARFITKFAAEDDSEWAVRASKATQINLIKLAITFYQAMLFSTNIRINSQSDNAAIKASLETFTTAATRRGESLVEFVRKTVFPQVALCGNGDVFVDLPVKDPNILTKADEDAADINKPFAYFVPALNRVEWLLDDTGAYTFYRSQDQIDMLVNPQFQIKQVKQYRIWTPEEVGVYNKSGQLENERPNPFGFIPAVPVVPFGSIRFFDDVLGMGLIDDQISMQREVINTLSMIADFHRQINFSQFTISHDVEAAEPPDQGELKEMGNHRGLLLKGKDSKAYFVSPNPDGVVAMTNYADWLVTKAFQLLLIPADSNNIKTHTSEQSIRNNLQQLYSVLADIAKQLEKALKRIVEMAMQVQGFSADEAQIEVIWDTGFSAQSFMNAITELTAFTEAFGAASPTATKEMLKQVVAGKLFSTDLMKTVEEEIGKWQIQQQQGTSQGNPEQSNGAINVAPIQRLNEFADQANKVDRTE